MVKMPIIQENKPFKDREDVKAEIRNCDLFGGICQYACFAFAALGVYGYALNATLGLEPLLVPTGICCWSKCHNRSYACSGG